jgi:hypothetical protein
MAAAAAPLRISTEATSDGLMSEARFCATVDWLPPLVDTVVLSIGCPSITNSGSCEPMSPVAPRMRIDADAPGSPDCVRTSTFGALAASALTTFAGSTARRIESSRPS